jgi:hypothetical protein
LEANDIELPIIIGDFKMHTYVAVSNVRQAVNGGASSAKNNSSSGFPSQTCGFSPGREMPAGLENMYESAEKKLCRAWTCVLIGRVANIRRLLENQLFWKGINSEYSSATAVSYGSRSISYSCFQPN